MLGLHEIEAPEAAGAVRSAGLPVGQVADYRFPPSTSCRSMHVQEFASIYVAHLDEVAPGCAPLQHLLTDAPLVAGLGVAGTILGAYLGRAAGAVAGLAAGLLLGVAVHHAAHRPPA